MSHRNRISDFTVLTRFIRNLSSAFAESQSSFPYFILLVPCLRLRCDISVIPHPQSYFPFSSYLFSIFWFLFLYGARSECLCYLYFLTWPFILVRISPDELGLLQQVGRQRRRPFESVNRLISEYLSDDRSRICMGTARDTRPYIPAIPAIIYNHLRAEGAIEIPNAAIQ